MNTDAPVSRPHTVCLLFWVEKLETTHLLQRKKQTLPIVGATRLAIFYLSKEN